MIRQRFTRASFKVKAFLRLANAQTTAAYRLTLYDQILAGKPRSGKGESWWASFSAFEEWQPPQIWYALFLILVAEMVTIYAWSRGHPEAMPHLDPEVHATLMGLLAFLLGFRTSQAYDRWWAGRTLWGQIVSSSRNLASNAAAVFTDIGRLRRLILRLVIFAWAVRDALRGTNLGDSEDSDLVLSGLMDKSQVRELTNGGTAYLALIDEMRTIIQEELAAQTSVNSMGLKGHWDLVVGDDIRTLLTAVTSCEGINTTPMPFNYLTFLRIYMIAWSVSYPIFVIEIFGWLTLPLVACILFILTKLEEMAREMSEPFGLDTHDLPIDELCYKIEKSLYEILSRVELAEQRKSTRRKPRSDPPHHSSRGDLSKARNRHGLQA